MRIADVRTTVVGTSWRDLTFVEVVTDEGLVGLGEARMLNHTEALLGYLREGLPRHVLGGDPFRIQHVVTRLTKADFARAGEIAMTAAGVIEMACWDIVGKALGQPVYALLGGAVRDRIKAYANGWYRVERSPDEFHAAAQQVVERGYRALKFDPFGPGRDRLEHDELMHSIALTEAVRDAVGPETELLIEMHGRFNPAAALEIIRLLAPYRPAWVEEPVPPENIKALAKVAAQAQVPIATGERMHTRYDFRELFELQAADVVQPDISHFGGLLETKHLAATAETHYVQVAPHNVGGPVLTAANLQLAACTTNFRIQEYFGDFADVEVGDVARGLPAVVDGYFALPQGPGLGVTFNAEAAAALPREDAHFDLFSEGWQFRR